MAIATVNPTTGQLVKTFEALSDAQIEAKLAKAAETFVTYRKVPCAERARMMRKAADILETEKEKFAKLMTTEVGKTYRSAVEEALKCATGCRYYAENAERFLADEIVETSAKRSYISYQPLGPILAVMPWNFPFWQVLRFAAPALMAGNVGLLKHASIVPQCALAIEDLFRRAGFPEGAFQTLLIGSQKVEKILDDPRVKAATLTGSEGAGVQVGMAAEKRIKKGELRRGGEGICCEFERRFVSKMEALKVGDPFDEKTELGPLATADGVADLDRDVQKTVRAGARVLTGGKPLDRPGNFYAPTVLTDIPKDSPAYKEELFGPGASVFRAADIADAVVVGNV